MPPYAPCTRLRASPGSPYGFPSSTLRTYPHVRPCTCPVRAQGTTKTRRGVRPWSPPRVLEEAVPYSAVRSFQVMEPEPRLWTVIEKKPEEGKTRLDFRQVGYFSLIPQVVRQESCSGFFGFFLGDVILCHGACFSMTRRQAQPASRPLALLPQRPAPIPLTARTHEAPTMPSTRLPTGTSTFFVTRRSTLRSTSPLNE